MFPWIMQAQYTADKYSDYWPNNKKCIMHRFPKAVAQLFQYRSNTVKQSLYFEKWQVAHHKIYADEVEKTMDTRLSTEYATGLSRCVDWFDATC